jgi:hypothetical protein
MMGPVSYFFWLASQAIEVGIGLLPIYAIVALLGLGTAGVSAARDPESLRRKWRWLLFPLAIPVLILAYGVAFHYSGPIGSAPAWRVQVLNVLVWSHVPIGLVQLAVVRRNPLVPLGLSVFQWWLSLSAAFMSSMSVTNNWL